MRLVPTLVVATTTDGRGASGGASGFLRSFALAFTMGTQHGECKDKGERSLMTKEL